MRFLHKKVIRNPSGDPYLVRWSVPLPGGASIKLHHILRSDEDRDLHDHPWSFVSVILRGGYFEHQYAACPLHTDGLHQFFARFGGFSSCSCGQRKDATIRTWRRVGAVLRRPVPSPHRLELPAGRTAWSLVFTSPYRRQWGFYTICGWIPWMHYEEAKGDGC